MSVAQLIIALISAAPQAIQEITALYNSVRSTISATDQTEIDALLATAQATDAAATAKADAALDAAALRS